MVFSAGFFVINKNYNNKRYLYDFGKGDRNKVSFCIEWNVLIIEIFDDKGKKHELTSEIDGHGPYFAFLDIINRDDGLYISFILDEEEQEVVVSKRKVDFKFDYENSVYGASSERNMGATFIDIMSMTREGVLPIDGKLQLYSYYKTLISGEIDSLLYEDHEYLVSSPNSNFLVQANEGEKPHYIKWRSCSDILEYIKMDNRVPGKDLGQPIGAVRGLGKDDVSK